MNSALYFKLFPFHIFIKKTVLQRSSMRYVRINCSCTHKQLKLSGLLHFPPHICLFIATFDFLCLCRHYTRTPRSGQLRWYLKTIPKTTKVIFYIRYCIFGSFVWKLCWSDNCSLERNILHRSRHLPHRFELRTDRIEREALCQGAYVIQGTILFVFSTEKCRSGSAWFSEHNAVVG